MSDDNTLEARIERLEGLTAYVESVQRREVLRARAHGQPLTAAVWRAWLHPRGRNGRFIDKLALVDVFDSNGRGDPQRGRVTNITRKAMTVDISGQKVTIPTKNIGTRVQLAPRALARLDIPEAPRATAVEGRGSLDDPTGSVEKVLASHEMAYWTQRAAEFSKTLDTTDSLNARGDAVADLSNDEWNAIDATVDGSGVPGSFRKVSAQLDDAFNAHSAFVSNTVDSMQEAGLSIDDMFYDADNNEWSPAITEYASALVDRMLAKADEQRIPKDRKSVVLGGLPGAGKSSIIKKLGINDDDNPKWLSLNPDLVKEEMIRDGVFPQIAGLSPMETVGAIHELSSQISKTLSERAMAEGYNVIHDVTLATPRAADKIVALTNIFGYEADAIFVDVPVDMSVKSQIKRHVGGLNRLRTGRSDEGGRFVPTFVLNNAVPNREGFNSANEEVFTDLMKTGFFRRWGKVNNTNYVGRWLGVGAGASPVAGDPAALSTAQDTAPGRF